MPIPKEYRIQGKGARGRGGNNMDNFFQIQVDVENGTLWKLHLTLNDRKNNRMYQSTIYPVGPESKEAN
jgi:hypothetical protein